MKRPWALVVLGFVALSMTFGQSSSHVVARPETVVWQTGDIFPQGADMVALAGNPHHPGDFTIRIRTSGNYHVAPYSHPEFENITVLSGSLHVGFGSPVSANSEEVLKAGSFVNINPGTVHYWWTDEVTVMQLHGNGCLQPIYVNASAPVPPCQ